MNPEAQAFLAQLLAQVRRGSPLGRVTTSEDSQRTFSNFSSALQAFKVVGAIDDDEAHDWTNRLLVALGEEPVDPPQPCEMRLISIGVGPPPNEVPRPIPEFVRLLPASSDATATRFGGRFQVLGIELYDTQFAVVWRLAPPPDQEAMFADDVAALERDTEGLPDQRREMLKRRLLQQLSMQRQEIKVTDDLGTTITLREVVPAEAQNERTGRMMFHPVPSPDATLLSIQWEDVVHGVTLRA